MMQWGFIAPNLHKVLKGFDLEGKENKGYYQCYKRFAHSMIAQACMFTHISHLYGYKIRGEDLPRVAFSS